MTEDRRYYPAAHNSGRRAARDLHVIVIHSTESTGRAADVARYFQSPASGGSAQLVVGDDGTYRCLDDLTIPWGAPPLNTNGLHVEQVGKAGWTTGQWLEHPHTIEACAEAVAEWSVAYSIPLVWLTPDDLRAGRRGVTSHANVSLAFRKTNHTDPGAGYPAGRMLELAAAKARPAPSAAGAVDKWTWLRWWLGEGEFARFRPHDEAHRPAGLPKRIPQAWWRFARAFLARRANN